jgi:hypothetical protein
VKDDLIKALAAYSGMPAGSPELETVATAVADAFPFMVTLVKHGYGSLTFNVFKGEYDSCELSTRHKASTKRK